MDIQCLCMANVLYTAVMYQYCGILVVVTEDAFHPYKALFVFVSILAYTTGQNSTLGLQDMPIQG